MVKLKNGWSLKEVCCHWLQHDLNDIFDPVYYVPRMDSGDDWNLYLNKNTFVYSIWTSRVYGSYPLQLIREYEDSKDGRAVYFAFLDHYESRNNLEQVGLMALDKLSSLQLTYRSQGGVAGYVTQFREDVLDLKDAGKPLDADMGKSMFLSSIKDRDYSTVIDSCIENPNMTLEDCIMKIEQKYQQMNNAGRSSHPSNQRSHSNNMTTQNNSTNNYNNHTKNNHRNSDNQNFNNQRKNNHCG